MCVLYGVSIYFLLPLALLTLNVSLILIVFTSILLGMLLGLVIVGFNFQSMIEIVVTYFLFFWEHKSMKILILKNLIAHRLKNRMTAVIYSMALGTLIFIIVIANVQIKYVSQSGYFKQTDLYI
jgi:hypothetical protein